MTAIELAARLAACFLSSHNTLVENATILHIAAGLHEAEHLAESIGPRRGVYSALLRLSKRGLVELRGGMNGLPNTYHLTPEGKAYIRTEILPFFAA